MCMWRPKGGAISMLSDTVVSFPHSSVNVCCILGGEKRGVKHIYICFIYIYSNNSQIANKTKIDEHRLRCR